MWCRSHDAGLFFMQKSGKCKNDNFFCQNLLTRKLVMVIMQLQDDNETCQKVNENCQVWNNENMKLRDRET